MKKISIILVFMLSSLALFQKSTKATAVLANLEELASSSGSIVIGTVEEIECQKIDTDIYTIVTFRVEKYLKQNPKKKKITICYAGGKIGEEGFLAEDEPEFSIGERCLVFLREGPFQRGPFKDAFAVTGLSQGKYTIDDDMLINMVGKFQGGQQVPLKEAITQIKEALKGE